MNRSLFFDAGISLIYCKEQRLNLISKLSPLIHFGGSDVFKYRELDMFPDGSQHTLDKNITLHACKSMLDKHYLVNKKEGMREKAEWLEITRFVQFVYVRLPRKVA